ncbi:MAG: zinc-dependent metalloprotease [Myxococcota bacterium]|nr:zinc-dependent metalloprotease [Myxococcota bacterium]
MRQLLSALALVGLFSACAQDVADIDRTKPNKVHKSMFQGTWYFRGTVTEVAPDMAGLFEGIATGLSKVRWEITESELRGWTSNETVIGMDQEIDDCRRVNTVHVDGRIDIEETRDEDCMRRSALDGPQLNQDGYRTRWGRLPDAYKGSMVISFPIAGHFDVKRGYNPATGEQTNVLGENASDRDWWQRDYMRVSWGSPSVQFINGELVNSYGDDSEPENSDHRIRFLTDDGTSVANGQAAEGQEVRYFDFGTRQAATMYALYGGRRYPYCYFSETTSCDAAKVAMRYSFLKTEAMRDFAPVAYDDTKMGRFGYFRTERYGHMRRRGLTESGRVRLASVHNLWKTTYQRKADGNYKLEAVKNDADETVAYRRMEIPVQERQPKPMAYHLSPYFPEAIKEYAYRVGDSWNDAYRRTIAAAWGYQSASEADEDNAGIPDMYVVCDNPVPAEIPARYRGGLGDAYYEVCGAAGTRALPGDLRYNTMYWVHDRNDGPLGYGPSYQDPESGETISGTAWVYGAAVDTYAQYALDLVNAMNGDLDIDDIRSGDYVKAMVAGSRHVTDPRNMPIEDFDNLLKDEDGPLGPSGRAVMERIERISADPAGELGDDITHARHRRMQRFLKESPLADDLVNGEILAAAAGNRMTPGGTVTDAMHDDARSLLSGNMDAIERRKEINDVASHLSIWTRDNFEDSSLIGLAKEMKERYADRPDAQDEMYQELRGRIFQGVMEHEVGHTLGLRHNFAGSYDAMNYQDDFWRVRKAGLKRAWTNIHSDGSLTVSDLLGFRNLTSGELEGAGAEDGQYGGVSEYQYSSIMDYGATFNSDFHGIGKYDEAAILFGYAGKVEVFDQLSRNNKYLLKGSAETVLSSHAWDVGTGNYNCLPSFEDRVSPGEKALTEKLHYAWLPILFSDAAAPSGDAGAAVNAAVEAGVTNLGPSNRRLIDYSVIEEQLNVEREHRRTHRQDCAKESAALHPDRPVMVPYMFCSDEWVGSVANCNRWDEGADPAAILERTMNQLDDYYWFNNYKRDRVSFSTTSPANRALSRTYPTMLLMYQQWLFGRNQTDLILEYPWRTGVFDSLNRFGEVLSKPRYGTYYLSNNGEDAYLYDYEPRALGEELDQVNNIAITADFVVPRGVGRKPFSSYDYDGGYYYYERPLEAGHFWDFYAALLSQGNATAAILGTESAADQRRFYLPFHLVFPESLDRLYSGIITNRQKDYAPKLFVRDLGGDEAACVASGSRVGGTGITGKDNDCYLMVGKPIFDWRGVTSGALVDGERNYAAPFATNDVDGENWDDGITVRLHNNYTNKLYATIFGAMFFTSTWERNFIDGMKIWRVGTSEDHSIAPGHQRIEFYDPRSGFVYASQSEKVRPCAVTDEERDNALAVRTICDGQVAQGDWNDADTALSEADENIENQDLDCDANGVPDECSQDRARDGLNLADQCVRKLCAQDAKRFADSRLDDAVSWSLRFRDLYRALVD